MCGSASVSPVTVSQGLNHSLQEISVPTRASVPPETIRVSFIVNKVGNSAL